jgi:hypothetical protein
MTTAAKNIIQYLLAMDGVNQSQRSQPALDPANVKLDGRTMSELVRFVYELAAQVKYYDKNNNPQGNWKPFFDHLLNGAAVMSDTDLQTMMLVKTDVAPHIALLLAFLQVYAVAANDLNTLTKKRLDYYYQEVLRLQRTVPGPDEVHVLFELGKSAKPLLLKKGALLDAGKTSTGLPLQYAADNDIVISHTVAGMTRSSYTDAKPDGKKIVFKANDASLVVNESATAWRPFGTSQLSIPPESRLMEPVSFGWAAASPNLLLAEGKRTITLQIALRSFKGTTSPELILTSMLAVSLTGSEGWLTEGLVWSAKLIPGILLQDPELENPFTLELSVELNESLPAVTAYSETLHLGSYTTVWPVIRVLFKPESYISNLLSGFRVENIVIKVEAKGVKNLVLQNDQATQANDKPVLPFGNTPFIQSNFYIGSEEVFSKTLTSIGVNLEWQDPPESFADHYSSYGNSNVTNNNIFLTAIDLLNNRNWNTRLVFSASLFNAADPARVQSLFINESSFATQTSAATFRRNAALKLAGAFDNKINQGFIRLVLAGPTKNSLGDLPVEAPFEAFGHKTFPVAYTDQVILLSKFTGVGTKPELPKQPYTPVLKSVSVDYTAKDEFKPNDPNGTDQFFMQDVFGPAETVKDDTALLVVPQPGNGSLYIGVKNATAPQTLSFLLQIEEGSVEGEELLRSSDLNWSYLAGNYWKNISSADIIEESTGGLQKPGLIRLNMGADATVQHSLMPKAMHWIRASVKDNPKGAAAITSINTEAAKATLVLPGGVAVGYETHLAQPLGAGSISKLVVKVPAIKKITQPFPSFGGRNAESDDAFYRRISERLRHKKRGVSGWDFERLALESFPEIYKIKCLPHSDTEKSFKPGDLRLVVVPDWRKRPTGNPLQPKMNRNRLREIADFVKDNYASPFATVHVSNPVYETLVVDCKVSFHAEFDAGYYTVILEEDIKKFLSPWAYLEGQDIVFGGKVHASEILAFIEGREYVDFITDFELYHRYEGVAGGGIGEMTISFDFIVGETPQPSIGITSSGTGGKTINVDFIVGTPVEVAAATRPDSILVSNISHRIQAVQADMSGCQGIQHIGIGQMIIGLDFIPIS